MTKPIEPIYQAIAAKVRMLRETLDLTQEDLAKRTGMSRPSIVNMELGRQRIMLHDVDKLAKAFGTTPKNIMKGIWL